MKTCAMCHKIKTGISAMAIPLCNKHKDLLMRYMGFLKTRAMASLYYELIYRWIDKMTDAEMAK